MAARHLARTDPGNLTQIGDAVTLDRNTSRTTATPGASVRTVDGVQLTLRADPTFAGAKPVPLALSVMNKTGRPIGYLRNRETHFTLLDQAHHTLWTDQSCRPSDSTSVPPAFIVLNPDEQGVINDFYPGGACTAPAGTAYLTGGLTVCLNLQADHTCRGASDARLQAVPIAVTIS